MYFTSLNGEKSRLLLPRDIAYEVWFKHCSIFNKAAYKMRILVMIRPPLPPCTHLYALQLTSQPPLDAYVINGRPLGRIRCTSDQ